MTLQDAPEKDIIRAVRHSMVIIDVGKHHYDYKRSYEENGIADLKKRYQPPLEGKKQAGGAATLISRSKSEEHVPLRSPNAPYKIDPKTGKKVFTVQPDYKRFYKEYKKDGGTGEFYYTGKTKERTTKSTKMYETEDARTLSSGTVMEEVYAEYANRLKALGNRARKASIEVKDMEYSPLANKAYAKEVASLDQKLFMIGYNRGLTISQTSEGDIRPQTYSGNVSQKGDGDKVLYSIPSQPGSSRDTPRTTRARKSPWRHMPNASLPCSNPVIPRSTTGRWARNASMWTDTLRSRWPNRTGGDRNTGSYGSSTTEQSPGDTMCSSRTTTPWTAG